MKKNSTFHGMKLKNKIMAAATTGMAVVSTTIPTYANQFSAYSGTDSTKIMNGVINFFGTIGTWGGGLYAIAAVFTLILAIRNEDNEGRNKALLNLLAAIALLSLGVILKLFFS